MTDAKGPSTISGLVGWYTGFSAEVTNGSVSSWKDLSGQGNHVTTIRASPKVSSVAVDNTLSGDNILAFHYGNFDNAYGDGSRATAAQNGRIYADTLSSEIPIKFGSLISANTANGVTTYTWTPQVSAFSDVLVVAGGGGGGSGGGGAGGFIFSNVVIKDTTYTVAVGDGGSGGGGGAGGGTGLVGIPQNGYNSAFSAIVSTGGGSGGGNQTPLGGNNGGSGGGGRYDQPNVTLGSGIAGQGFGGGRSNATAYGGGGGGGGAGANGSNATSQTTTVGRGGGGGIGRISDITGTSKYYAGGGGGGANTNSVAATAGGQGGQGGGGQGSFPDLGVGSPGQAHTGGGGGGGDPEGTGAKGGSGIVIIRYSVINTRNSTKFPFIYGTATDGLRFPTTVMNTTSNYTLFHVARYYKPSGTPARGRIFDGVENNWLSGFAPTVGSGVAYHDKWLTTVTDKHGDAWVLSTDQRNLYRSNEVQRGTTTGGGSKQLSINYGAAVSTAPSDWAVAEVIVYNRELSSTEYLAIESYLSAKYFNNKVVPSSGVISGSVLNAILYNGTEGSSGSSGYPISIGRLGVRNGIPYSQLLKASDFRLPGAIDTISSSPMAAYSMRKLFYSYGGPQFRARRSSDSVYADIYMNKDGYSVRIEGSSETDLTTWLGGASGHVVTWYDQSGNKNHTKAYSTARITDLPALLNDNGRYVIYFPGTNINGGWFNAGLTTFNIATNGGVSTFSRVNMISQTNYERVYDYGSGSPNNNLLFTRVSTGSNSRFEVFQGSTASTLDVVDGLVYDTWQSFGNRVSGSGNSWTITTRRDGIQIGTTTTSVSLTDRTVLNSYIGRSLWSGDYYSHMKLRDQIFFNTGGVTDADFAIMESALN